MRFCSSILTLPRGDTHSGGSAAMLREKLMAATLRTLGQQKKNLSRTPPPGARVRSADTIKAAIRIPDRLNLPVRPDGATTQQGISSGSSSSRPVKGYVRLVDSSIIRPAQALTIGAAALRYRRSLAERSECSLAVSAVDSLHGLPQYDSPVRRFGKEPVAMAISPQTDRQFGALTSSALLQYGDVAAAGGAVGSFRVLLTTSAALTAHVGEESVARSTIVKDEIIGRDDISVRRKAEASTLLQWRRAQDATAIKQITTFVITEQEFRECIERKWASEYSTLCVQLGRLLVHSYSTIWQSLLAQRAAAAERFVEQEKEKTIVHSRHVRGAAMETSDLGHRSLPVLPPPDDHLESSPPPGSCIAPLLATHEEQTTSLKSIAGEVKAAFAGGCGRDLFTCFAGKLVPRLVDAVTRAAVVSILEDLARTTTQRHID